MELSSPKIKTFLILFTKNGFLIYWEMELYSLKLKKTLIFQEKTFLTQKIKKKSL